MEQLTFDERNIMKSVFNGQLVGIAEAAKVSVPTVRNVLNGWTCYSELLLKVLRYKLDMVRIAEDNLQQAKLNKKEVVLDMFSHGIVT